MTNHAPTPWEIISSPSDQPNVLWIEDTDGALVAVIHGEDRKPGRLQANANLFTAAPDLLAACRLALGRLQNPLLTTSLFDDVKHELRKVILQAEGSTGSTGKHMHASCEPSSALSSGGIGPKLPARTATARSGRGGNGHGPVEPQ